MPQGKGTYGSKVGRPAGTKMKKTTKKKVGAAGAMGKFASDVSKLLKRRETLGGAAAVAAMAGLGGAKHGIKMALKLARKRKPTGRLSVDDIKRAKKALGKKGPTKKRGGGIVRRGMGMAK